jgi:hypothetical protein
MSNFATQEEKWRHNRTCKAQVGGRLDFKLSLHSNPSHPPPVTWPEMTNLFGQLVGAPFID